jgi:hypothetical protein
MKQDFLFYDGPLDAVEKSIAVSGKPKKAIAEAVWPGRQPETAKSLLSRALSPENTDVNLNVENLLTIMRETRPDDFIYFLCDDFGFERPAKKTSDKIKSDIVEEVKQIRGHLAALLRQLPTLEDK